ncbi:MAG: S8 family serine peptidase [Phycisphaerales bacterium]|nr:S8 family serine peptidase [Phycisphaerales bacterium]
MRHACLAAVLAALLISMSTSAAETMRLKTGLVQLQQMSGDEITLELTRFKGREHATHCWLRFTKPPTAQERQRIEATGLQLLAPVGPGGFTASLHDGLNVRQLVDSGLISEVRELDTTWKMHPWLLENRLPTWTVDRRQQQRLLAGEAVDADALVRELAEANDPFIAVYVLLHADMPLKETAAALELSSRARRASTVEVLNGIVMEIPFSQTWTLAEDDRIRWIEPALPKFVELNDSNRILTQVDQVFEAPYDLSGEGVVVMVYDGGFALDSHGDFGGRLTVRDSAGLSDHATHVSGTIGGDGSVSGGQYRGMAPDVTIESYGFEQEGGLSEGFLYSDPGDLADDYGDAINSYGAVLSNNSIGTNTAPNGFPCEWTGDYGVTSNLIDSVVRGDLGAPMRIVWANGNERQTDRCGDLYNTTAPPACAKNHITVGAMNSNDDSVTSFTSWGPCDDGRIKPDISSTGCQSDGDGGVTSCSSSGSYSSKCGTSMSSPTVCGISALLIQDYRAQFPDLPEMAGSTLKVLLAHSADDGGNAGPDCQYGYGSIRARDAVDQLRTGSFLEADIAQDESYSFLIVVPENAATFQVTAAWDDVPAEPLVLPSLVNDIDVVVLGPDGTRHYPWTINPADPGAPATQDAEDHLNNIEQVTVNTPAPGIWQVELRGTVVTTNTQLVSVTTTPELIDCSSSGIIALDRSVYPLEGELVVRVVDCDLNANDTMIETVEIELTSTTNADVETLLLVESGEATSEFVGSMPHSVTDAPGVLQVADGGSIGAWYDDESDVDGNPVTVGDDATVDGVDPAFVSTDMIDIQPRNAIIEVILNEPCRLTVNYGTSCDDLSGSKSVNAFAEVHQVSITGLEDDTNYFYDIEFEDRAGNTGSNDNAGDCFAFTTPQVPDFYTEQFSSGIDLDGTSILFTPNGTIDFYAACIESISALPVDPADGTPLSLSDDSSSSVSSSTSLPFYGTNWDTIHVNSNGSITFNGGDSDYSESLGEHFSQPRISALWDDLNPSVGGTVSWKETGSSMVVTFEGIAQYGTNNSNTFQVELFFNGDLRMSWYGLDADGALIGLSAGEGIDPDFLATDLSELDGGCGPRPPVTITLYLETGPGIPLEFTLQGSDDGLPSPPGSLAFVIDTLPMMPLRHLATGKLLSEADLPYVMQEDDVLDFSYEPYASWEGEDTFFWHADDGGVPPEGGSSAPTMVTILVADGPTVIHEFTMDEDPGWTMDGEWGWGTPTGGGGEYGYPDPTSGATGEHVVGYNLAGDYGSNLPERIVSTGNLDCTGASGIELRFMRWLNVETPSYDHASIEVSGNGGLTWSLVWENTSEVTDNSWLEMSYDISDIADDASAVQIRWIMGTTDASWQFSGWNIDDVRLYGIAPNNDIPGDINGDGIVGVDDLLIVIASWGPCGPDCQADINGDGIVGVDDLLIVLANWGSGGRSAPMPGDGDQETDAPRTPDLAEEDDDLFINDEVLAPAEDGGLVRVDSDFLQTENGVLEVELVDLNPIEGHDVLSIDGTAALGGGLVVRCGDGFVAQAGDRYGVLIALELHGEFTWTELPEIGPDLELVLCQHGGIIVVEVRRRDQGGQTARPHSRRGDVNRDGTVNSTDLHVLLEAWARGGFHDLDGDGRFTELDLAIALQELPACP